MRASVHDGVGPDGSLLVVSAVEPVPPQVRDHLLITHTLGVRNIVVFLNKCDLVADPARLAELEDELDERAEPSVLSP